MHDFEQREDVMTFVEGVSIELLTAATRQSGVMPKDVEVLKAVEAARMLVAELHKVNREMVKDYPMRLVEASEKGAAP